MLGKHELCCDRFHGFDWSKWAVGSLRDYLGLIPAAQEHMLTQPMAKTSDCKQHGIFPNPLPCPFHAQKPFAFETT